MAKWNELFSILFYGLLVFESGKTLYDLKMVELNSIEIEIEGYLNMNTHPWGKSGKRKCIHHKAPQIFRVFTKATVLWFKENCFRACFMISCQHIILTRFIGQSLSFLVYRTWMRSASSFSSIFVQAMPVMREWKHEGNGRF